MTADPSVWTVVDGRWILNRTIAKRDTAGVELHDGRIYLHSRAAS